MDAVLKALAIAQFHLNRAQALAEDANLHPEAAEIFKLSGETLKVWDSVNQRKKK